MMRMPEGWQAARLGDVSRIVSGATPKTAVAAFWGGDIAWVTPDDLSKDRSQTLTRGQRSLTLAGYESCSARLFPEGAVIYSSRAPIGYVAIAGGEMCTNQGCKTAVPPDYVDSKYLYHYLRWATPDISARASGTTFKEISGKRFAETMFMWPDYTEQRRIVDILEDHLSRLDAAARGLADSRRRSIRMRQASLAAAVGCARDDARSTTCRIADVARVGSGATPLKSRRDFYEGGTVPWITSGDLWQSIVRVPKQFITEAALRETAVKVWPAGTLLVAMYGEGKTRGTAAELGVAATTNQACAAINLHPQYQGVRPWLRLYLDSYYWALRRLAAGGVQPNLSLGLIKAIELPIPRDDLMSQLIGRDVAWQTAEDRLASDLTVSEKGALVLRSALLQAAFSGRLTGSSRDTEIIEELAGV